MDHRVLAIPDHLDEPPVQVSRAAEQPAGVRDQEISVALPVAECPRVFSVDLQGDRSRAAQAPVPGRRPRCLVLILRRPGQRGIRLEVTEVVAAGRRKRLAAAQLAQQAGTRLESPGDPFRLRLVVLLHERVAGHAERVLGEESRQFLGIHREHDVSLSAVGNVLEQFRIRIALVAQPDHADGDAALLELLEQFLVIAGLLAVGRVGEQQDVAGRVVSGLGQFLARRDQRHVDENPPTLALDPQCPVRHRVRIGHLLERLDNVWRTVDGDHRHLVLLAQQPDALGRAQVGQVHLRLPAGHLHRHAAGTIQHDRHRHSQLSVLLAQLHRDRQHVVQRAAVIPSLSETPFTAGQHQSATEFLDPLRQPGHLQAADVGRRGVLDAHSAVAVEGVERERMVAGTGHVDGQPRRCERPLQVACLAIGIEHQQAWSRFDPNHSRPPVVLGHRVIVEFEFGRVVMHSASLENVAKQQTIAARTELSLGAGQFSTVTHHPQRAGPFTVGSHPDGKLERLTRRYRQRQPDRLDSRVSHFRPLERPHVNRHPGLAGLTGCR